MLIKEKPSLTVPPILRLPVELQLLISGRLRYKDALALKLSCQYFLQLVDPGVRPRKPLHFRRGAKGFFYNILVLGRDPAYPVDTVCIPFPSTSIANSIITTLRPLKNCLLRDLHCPTLNLWVYFLTLFVNPFPNMLILYSLFWKYRSLSLATPHTSTTSRTW